MKKILVIRSIEQFDRSNLLSEASERAKKKRGSLLVQEEAEVKKTKK